MSLNIIESKSALMDDIRNDVFLRFSDVIYDVVTFYYVKNNMASVVWGLSAGNEW